MYLLIFKQVHKINPNQYFTNSIKFISDFELKPGLNMIVTIVASAENGCDNSDDYMETPIFFLVTIVTIRIATIVEIEISSISTIVAIK